MGQLEYLAAVTRSGSLRRAAAEELHLSQPALSETVRNLERELGVDLLERRRSGAKVSDEGRELLPHIMGVLDAVDRLRSAAGDQHRISPTIRLGTVNTATAPLVIPAVRELPPAHPRTQVELVGAQQSEKRLGVFAAFVVGTAPFIRRHLTNGDHLSTGLGSLLAFLSWPPRSSPSRPIWASTSATCWRTGGSTPACPRCFWPSS